MSSESDMYAAKILALEKKLEKFHLSDEHALRRAFNSLSQHVSALKSEAEEFNSILRATRSPSLSCFCFLSAQESQGLISSWQYVYERVDIMNGLISMHPPPPEKASRD